jgi:hypothetical protein
MGRFSSYPGLIVLLASHLPGLASGFTVTLGFQPPIPAQLLAEMVECPSCPALEGLSVAELKLFCQGDLVLDLKPILEREDWLGTIELTADPAPGGRLVVRLVQIQPRSWQPAVDERFLLPQALYPLSYGPPGLKVRIETAKLVWKDVRVMVMDPPSHPEWVELSRAGVVRKFRVQTPFSIRIAEPIAASWAALPSPRIANV